MISRATLRSVRKHAADCVTAARCGWAVNSKDMLLRKAADDILRLADEVERLRRER